MLAGIGGETPLGALNHDFVKLLAVQLGLLHLLFIFLLQTLLLLFVNQDLDLSG